MAPTLSTRRKLPRTKPTHFISDPHSRTWLHLTYAMATGAVLVIMSALVLASLVDGGQLECEKRHSFATCFATLNP